jgi:triosephosphate isomerase
MPRLVAGNWKLYKTNDEACGLARDLLAALLPAPGCDVVLCPPFTALSEVRLLLAGSTVGLGGQDLYWEAEGAFTGEVSGPMLRSAGCTHVIVGHSERRQYFGETDETVARKTRAALEAGLTPIVCLGETLAEREAGRTSEVVLGQFDRGPGRIQGPDAAGIVLAYEPVWAIGTGRNASPQQAAEVHELLRRRAVEAWGRAADRLRILYGGSVKPDNAAALFEQPELDGALVGGASLAPATFLPIVRAAARPL